ncbi:Protoporphyrinogen IX oxidase, novel form, HemJ [hydrothermal vent metagenome]|uniref:Protoporphyrinogen IX oxidase, novel form, HemJ n=1 Tax=hydrothermal vent metagenome TaxID=652676 RepID=A0A3B0TLS3_9ZZZZ
MDGLGNFLGEYLAWIRAAHIISVIAWMAGLLYLPRLFVYHVDSTPGGGQSETFKIMERRLLRAIMTPAMLATWVFGLAMAITPGVVDLATDGWFHAKMVSVLIMSGVHGFFAKTVRIFAEDMNERPARFFRLVNEVPTVLMIVIVVLVIVRPF